MIIESIYDRYVVARWAYLMAEPILSDVEYDKLEKEFRIEFPTDYHSTRPWSFDECPTELLKKYGYSNLICNPVMGYMAESIYSINNKEEYNERFRSLNERSRLSFKIDGWNTRVSYFNGHIVKIETRGRSGNNIDIRDLSPMFPKTVPYKGRVAVTGETSIPNKVWPEFKTLTGNSDQRASVRTAIARGSIEYLSFLAFNIFIEDEPYQGDAYELLQSLGFQTPKFVWVNNFSELEKYIWYMGYINRVYGYLTDGLVIENSQYQLAIRLGAWEEHSMLSYVTGYEEDQGMYGVFFKVKCYPIDIEGKTFSKISINNIANIVENGLSIGAPIAFSLRSSANVVLNVTETAELQKKWKGKYEEYKRTIVKQS